MSIIALLLFPLSISGQRTTSQPAQRPLAKFRKVANAIPNKYIVILNDDVVSGRANAEVRRSQVNAAATNLTQRYGGRPGFLYDALKGFSIELLSEQAAIALSRNPQVKFVEEAGTMQLLDVQSNPPWGLDRIDQAGPVGTVTGGTTTGSYIFNATGAGVTAYVIDGGIHNLVGERLLLLISLIRRTEAFNSG